MLSADADSVSWLRFAFASLTVLGLMAGLAWLLRYLAMRGFLKGGARPNGRLKVIETLPLDARRRLVLVACDDKEHLLLLGPAGDVVVRKGHPFLSHKNPCHPREGGDPGGQEPKLISLPPGSPPSRG